MRAGILGATGYTGFELVKILGRHPLVELAWAASESYAGQPYSNIYPCPVSIALVAPDAAPLDQVDVVFLCTPHHASAPWAARALAAGAKVVDLSADLRLRDLAVYEAWYGEHGAPELLPRAVYGLTEIYRDQVAGADLVANPGCYPTGPLLALEPLLHQGLVLGQRIIIDAASGVSGAGAKPSATTHFVQVHDNYAAYKIGHTHRHTPEIEQELTAYGGFAVNVTFSPHLLPVSRGILSTIYVTLDDSVSVESVVGLWQQRYGDCPFVHVLPVGELASLAHVVNTNRAALSVAPAGLPGEFIIVTAIDNLLKGASGQAAQNMNVMLGLDETLGLL